MNPSESPAPHRDRGFLPLGRRPFPDAVAGLGMAPRGLLVTLALAADHRTGLVPGTTVTAWADELGDSWRAVRAALEALHDRGLVTYEPRRGQAAYIAVNLSAIVHARAISQEAPANLQLAPANQQERPAETPPTKEEGTTSSSGPSIVIEPQLPIGEEEETTSDNRVTEALAAEARRRLAARTGRPLVNPARWVRTVTDDLAAEHGLALEAEAARDPAAPPAELWRRATSTAAPERRRLGCDACVAGWLEPDDLAAPFLPCPTCLPHLTQETTAP